ncbi:MAG: hypothetical protein GY774_24510, partial [Planctomycetes bacterium]|nr:hypothetical protein [Planctomycetota bacterium]
MKGKMQENDGGIAVDTEGLGPPDALQTVEVIKAQLERTFDAVLDPLAIVDN